ncbi:IclR family transcriptional regulator [Arthrobacter crystallopoietes]|uniref:DNA-binding transcriptional regulator, IclR family n=1 Tax=Crystallibacter crystallopoietes TaxID=37928 RepID=A0A1H1HY89_9MICC|nr:IclR family transcriptional regulator [Arthrobacter crystallopoietes]SDR30427.1 DNA-binding transcriptional regulator, IclR family [Arthrobacter crystallopoietes]
MARQQTADTRGKDKGLATESNAGSSPILVLHKVTQILDCFSIESPEPTLQEIIRKTGLPSSTCQRLVQSMLHEGFLDRDGDRYRIGIGLVRWATPGTLGLDVVRLVKPILQKLRDETGESASFYIRDGVYRTIVAVAETRHVVMRPFMVGQVMPIHAGAAGKIFLAYDPDARNAIAGSVLAKFTPATPDSLEKLDLQVAQTRKLGFAAAFGERHSDVGSISAPVFDHAGQLAGALGLGFPTQRIGPADAERLGPVVAQAARAASESLGFITRQAQ